MVTDKVSKSESEEWDRIWVRGRRSWTCGFAPSDGNRSGNRSAGFPTRDQFRGLSAQGGRAPFCVFPI